MTEIEKMIAATRLDRAWFRQQALNLRDADGNITPAANGMLIDAAACAIRQQALEDALKAVRKEKGLAR